MMRSTTRLIRRWPKRRDLCTSGGSGNGSSATGSATSETAGSSGWTAMQRANEHNAARAQVAAWLDGMKTLMIENPLRANAAISGTLCAVGDLIAQTIERRMDAEPMDTSHDGFLGFDVGFDPGFDAKRTGRMLVYGTFVCGPVLHFWYGALAVVSEALSVSYVPVVGSRVGSLLLPWLGSFQKNYRT